VSWLPAILRQSNLPVSAGITAVSLFSVGGIAGSFVEGALMNLWGTLAVLLVEFVCTSLLIVSLAFSEWFPLTMAITLVLGFVAQAAQGGLGATAATIYPTSIRSTGVGWAHGIGRIGSIVGPVLGGVMLKLNWGPREILLTGGIPALLAAAATLMNMWLRKNPPPDRKNLEIVEERSVIHS
jgi:AAHS family 4-hydroxybenzoate transporter-like MFS transporter